MGQLNWTRRPVTSKEHMPIICMLAVTTQVQEAYGAVMSTASSARQASLEKMQQAGKLFDLQLEMYDYLLESASSTAEALQEATAQIQQSTEIITYNTLVMEVGGRLTAPAAHTYP